MPAVPPAAAPQPERDDVLQHPREVIACTLAKTLTPGSTTFDSFAKVAYDAVNLKAASSQRSVQLALPKLVRKGARQPAVSHLSAAL